MKSSIDPTSLTSSSIWEAPSQSMLVNTYENEKPGPALINVEELRAIGRIVRPIQARIETVTSTTILGCGSAGTGVGSYASFSQTSSANCARPRGN
jgi:hypothetical protein